MISFSSPDLDRFFSKPKKRSGAASELPVIRSDQPSSWAIPMRSPSGPRM